MKRDPIVEEVRKARQSHAAKFNYDMKAIFADLKQKEKNLRSSDRIASTQDSSKEDRKLIITTIRSFKNHQQILLSVWSFK